MRLHSTLKKTVLTSLLIFSGLSISGCNDKTAQLPEKEQQFIKIVSNYSSEFSKTENEIKQDKLRQGRLTDIDKAFTSGEVSNWVGTIESIQTDSSGYAYISVKLADNIHLKTWNNSFSDIGFKTIIKENTPLYSSLAELEEGKRITFSGSFFPDTTDRFKEASMTINGSMTDPEFIFKFTSISLKN